MSIQLIVPICIIIVSVFGIAMFFYTDRLQRRQRNAENDRQLYDAVKIVAGARSNVATTIAALLDLIADRQPLYWPSVEQFSAHLSKLEFHVINPFSLVAEPVLVFGTSVPEGAVFPGRTIVILIGPGKAVTETRDEDGITSLWRDEMPFPKAFEFLYR